MHRYEYKSEQKGTYIRCHPVSKKQQQQMLDELLETGLEILEKYSKEMRLWDDKFKLYRKVKKINGGYSKGKLIKPNYKTVFKDKNIQLQNSGDYGYEKAIKQSPFEIIAGECRKFYKIANNSDRHHLSPTQIELWNKAMQQAEQQITKIINDIFQGSNWETRDLPRLQASMIQKLFEQVQNMKIDAVDVEQQQSKQKDQILINTGLVKDIA